MSNINERHENNFKHAGLTHTEAKEALASYSAGEMQPDERAVVEQHLARCVPCQQALAETQQIRRILRTINVASSAHTSTAIEAGRATPSIADAVLAELQESERAEGSSMKSAMLKFSDRRTPQHRWSTIAAVFFLALLVGSMVVVLNLAHSNKSHTAYPSVPTLPPFPTLHTATASSFYAVLGHNLSKLDAKTGAIVWSRDLSKQPELHNISSVGTPITVNGTIYITATDGFGQASPIVPYVFAFHTSDGSLLWKTPVYSNAEIQEYQGISYGDLGFTSDPTVANGMLYVLSRTGKVYALNAADGSKRWEYDTHVTAFVDGGIWNSSSVIVDKDVVYGTMLNQVYAIDATNGHGLWSVLVNQGQIITQQLAVNNDMVYGASFDLSRAGSRPAGYAYVYAFNAKTGVRIWTSNRALVGFFSDPVVANGIVYLGSQEATGGNVYALRASDGSQVWHKSLDRGKMKIPEGGADNPLIVIDGVLYLGGTVSDLGATLKIGQTVPGISILFALDAANGLAYWQREFNNPYRSIEFVINGEIFATGDNDTIYRYSLADGHEIWHHKYGGLLSIAP